MSKSFIGGFVIGVAVLAVVGFSASRLQNKNTTLKDREEKEYQLELKDATSVRIGSFTEEQRKHSKLYAYYKTRADLMPVYGKISDFFVNPKGKFMETIVGVGLCPIPEPETPEKFLGKLAQESDAIIRGTVIKKVSQITEDDAFIFTDYDVVIKEILKNNMAAPLELERSITVTRPGGKVAVNGIVVKATDEHFMPLLLNHNVILFLKFIPETGAYKATQYTGAFELDGVSVRPLTEALLPTGVLQDEYSFLQTARAISNK
jgi:hypothetical protein